VCDSREATGGFADAAALSHPGGAFVDVVDLEVGPGALLAGLHVRDRGALLVADLRHVVLGRARVGLELPAEQGAPELLGGPRVVGRQLEMDDLAGYVLLLPVGT